MTEKAYAAGILFQSGKKIFLVRKRGDDEWGLPGGKIKPGEAPQDAARREVREECGINFEAEIRPYTLIDGYVTYLADRSPEFKATPGDGIEECGWFEGNSLPDNIHPGLIAALNANPLNETDVAKLIQIGALTSPQFFVNMNLFAIRITGTGIAWRSTDNQITFRDPRDYLTPEFLSRCAGVPVIWLHPEKNKLDSEEFARRVIGTITNSWITADNEVWGIARIYDEDAADLMANHQLSTSPTVTYSDPQLNTVTVQGDKVLVEDEPLLIDHVAVCEVGVWDKLRAPNGVKSNNAKSGDVMTKEEFMALFRECFAEMRAEMADSEKKDSACDSQGLIDREDERLGEERRMKGDSDDKKDSQTEKDRRDERRGEERYLRGDEQTEKDRRDERRGEERHLRADEQTEKDREDERRGEDRALGKYLQTEKDREDERRGEDRALGKYLQTEKDREDEREGAERYWEKAKGDDDDSSYLRREIEALKARLPEALTDQERAELSDAQMKADSAFSAQGMRAPAPLAGEKPLAYRRRLLVKLQSTSPDFKNIDLTTISDSQLLGLAERQIYADAQRNAALTVPAGQLREVQRRDMSGRLISTFQGDSGAAWTPFKSGKRCVVAFNTQI